MRTAAYRISQVALASLCGLICGLAFTGIKATSALATGDANTASCPNASMGGFREYLPDCRAYEMITPPYKEGYEFRILGESFPELDGENESPFLVGGSLGAINGGPDTASDYGTYKLMRTNAGWVTVPVDPSPSEFVVDSQLNDGYAAVSITGTGNTLYVLRKPTESVFSANLYLVKPNSAPQRIGPLLPEATIPPNSTGNRTINGGAPVEFAGATNDLSHVLYYIEPVQPKTTHRVGLTDLWPGDTTVLNGSREVVSLYEYAGTNHSEPTLVGLNDEGHPITQCGVRLGGPPKGIGFGAISNDGETVIFTAAPRGCQGVNQSGEPITGEGPRVYEIYARVAGKETIPISEPSNGPSGDCSTCNLTNPQSATFEGASSDGMKIFFSTEQELLPGSNGRSIYEFNRNGLKGYMLSLVASDIGSGGLAAVSPDGSRVYYVSEPVDEFEGPPNLYVARIECSEEKLPCGSAEIHSTYIATLSRQDAREWSATEARKPMSLTPNGLHLVFTSFADVVGNETGNSQQVFSYDVESTVLTRVSIGDHGYNKNGDGQNAEIPFVNFGNGPEGAPDIGVDRHPAVSNDGSVIVFQTRAALTPQAVEKEEFIEEAPYAARNVYEYRDGQVYLISDGKSATEMRREFQVDGAHVLGVSGSGDDVFFRTSGPLVSQDVDELTDVYDARVDGGFPEASANTDCGDGCQSGEGATSSLITAPGTQAFGGEAAAAVPAVVVKPRVKALAIGPRVARALAACRKRKVARRKRLVCEAAARRLDAHTAKKIGK
jgi:hypothetical protein